jgi:hypothetical protein
MSDPQLFHFSEDPTIEVFEPRPVRVPAERPPGKAWLNGPLVWAIDGWHEPMYFFPRDCPRILLWRKPSTSDEDIRRWWRGPSDRRILAHIEEAWLDRLKTTPIYRYTFGPGPFEHIGEIGTWVSRTAVRPISVVPVGDLLSALETAGVELRVMPDLLPLKGVWESGLHASGIRLRNAQRWNAPR